MVGLSNVLLILASLTGLTNGGLLELFKPAGNNTKSALGSALGTAFGRGLLGGMLTGVGNSPAGEKIDPGLANVLASFGQEFSGNTGTSTTGSSGSPGEPDSSEEKPKTSNTNAGGTGPTGSPPQKPPSTAQGESSPENPVTPATGESGSQIPQKTVPGESRPEIAGKPDSGAPSTAGTPGGDVARSMGAAAGAAIATSLIGVIMEAIKKKRAKKIQAQRGPEQSGARREKRSLVDDLGLMGSKGAGKGLNHVQGVSFPAAR